MAKIALDLHDIYNRGDKIETELNRVIQEAVEKRIKLVEIIPGKGTGLLKKRVLRFLDQPHFVFCTIAWRKIVKTLDAFLFISVISRANNWARKRRISSYH